MLGDLPADANARKRSGRRSFSGSIFLLEIRESRETPRSHAFYFSRETWKLFMLIYYVTNLLKC